MSRDPHNRAADHSRPLPALRFEILEAAAILRMSRAQLYKRIAEGAIRSQKDGARTYVTLKELERYVEACEETPPAAFDCQQHVHHEVSTVDDRRTGAATARHKPIIPALR